MSNWLPIESAPKDGAGFLVNCPHVDDGVSMMMVEKGVLVSLWDGKPWHKAFSGPTHWQPLPTPPT